MKYFLKLIIIFLTSSLLAMASSKGVNKKIVVNLTTQEAFAYEDGKLLFKGWISSGRKKYATPTGRYRVLAKESFHISNEWPEPDGGAEMPYMLRLTWSGIALHLGYVPNHPASHGCIRAKDGFIQELYKWADIGTRVIIKGKAPKRVSRKHRSPFYMTKYFYKKYNTSYKKEHRYLAKLNRKLKRLSRAHQIALAKKKRARLQKLAKAKRAKSIHIAKKSAKKRVYKSKRAKLIAYYSKFSYSKLNRIIRDNYRKKASILASKKLSKQAKIRKVKRINRVLKIIRMAKYAKKHHKKYASIKHKRVNS